MGSLTVHENAVTETLIATLQAAGDAVAERFLREVCGVTVGAARPLHYRLQASWEALGHTRAIVVGLAPHTGLADADTKTTPGSIIDAVIAGEVAVLIEVKVRGRCERAQLARHARHWALSVPDDVWAVGAGPGVALTDWARVGGWLARELGRGAGTAEAAALEPLADLLREERLAELDAAVPPAPRAQPVPVEAPPAPAALETMVAGVDLARLRDACAALYGPGAPEHVPATACEADTRRVLADFATAGMNAPAGLLDAQAGGVMTPRRVLSALYSGQAPRDAAPARWSDLRDRVIGRGGDRAVLLAMLAWADGRDGAAARRVRENVALVWERAPSRGPAVTELHGLIQQFSAEATPAESHEPGEWKA